MEAIGKRLNLMEDILNMCVKCKNILFKLFWYWYTLFWAILQVSYSHYCNILCEKPFKIMLKACFNTTCKSQPGVQEVFIMHLFTPTDSGQRWIWVCVLSVFCEAERIPWAKIFGNCRLRQPFLSPSQQT